MDLCGEGNADAKRPCHGKRKTMLTKPPIHTEFEVESLPANEQIPGGAELKNTAKLDMAPV